MFVWGAAVATERRVVLRIEDHDRQRSRVEYDAALLEDLAWLGFDADAGPRRQSSDGPVYEAALEELRRVAPVYACACSRATFTASAGATGRRWSGPGCPGGCRGRSLADEPGTALRVALPDGPVAWSDLRLGEQADSPAADGDLVIRDRAGNWTYHFCVVVDDGRQEVDLVVRGEDLLEATARQVALGELLGLRRPAYLHHPLVRTASGAKLSKAAGDTSVRDLRSAGLSAEDVIGQAAAAIGLVGDGVPLSAAAAARIAAGSVGFPEG